jgi:hypothetical protein
MTMSDQTTIVEVGTSSKFYSGAVLVIGSQEVYPGAIDINTISTGEGIVAVLICEESQVEFNMARLRKIGAARVIPVNVNSPSLGDDIERAVAAATVSSDGRMPSASLLRAARACAVPFDPDLLGPAGPIADSLARLCGAPVEFIAGGMLACVSGLASGRFVVRVRAGYEVAPILWFANVGDASSGKSPALDIILRPIRRFEAEAQRQRTTAVKRAIDDGEKPRAAQKLVPAAARALVSNASIEALQHICAEQGRAMIGAYDELSEWFSALTRYNRSATGDRGAWLSAHNGHSVTIDRRSLEEPLHIPHWGVALVGGIPPSVLNTLSRTAELENNDGLDARLLYFRPVLPPVAMRPDSGDAKTELALDRLMSRIMTWRIEATGTRTIEFDTDACERFEKWRFGLLNDARKSGNEVGAWIGKLPGLVARLAGCLAVIDAAMGGGSAPTSINKDQLKRAAGLADLLSAHRRRVELDRGAAPVEALAAELGAFVINHKVKMLNTFELRRGLIPGIRSEKVLRGVLRELHAAGWLQGWVTYRPDEPLPPNICIEPRVHSLAP